MSDETYKQLIDQSIDKEAHQEELRALSQLEQRNLQENFQLTRNPVFLSLFFLFVLNLLWLSWNLQQEDSGIQDRDSAFQSLLNELAAVSPENATSYLAILQFVEELTRLAERKSFTPFMIKEAVTVRYCPIVNDRVCETFLEERQDIKPITNSGWVVSGSPGKDE